MYHRNLQKQTSRVHPIWETSLREDSHFHLLQDNDQNNLLSNSE